MPRGMPGGTPAMVLPPLDWGLREGAPGGIPAMVRTPMNEGDME